MSARTVFAAELSRDAALKHARWSDATWRELVEGPAALLEQQLGAGGEAVLRAYLGLCAEGVALGYLFPHSTEANGFLNVAFRAVVPTQLARLPEPLRLSTMAALWNLGENLEAQPYWISAVFLKRLQSLSQLENLEAFVDDVTSAISRTPAPGTPLTKMYWMDASQPDARFLPGAMHFIAPAVVCVHDRLRTAVAGRPAVTSAVWLSETPLGLGPTRCEEAPAVTHVPSLDLSSVQRADPLIDDPFSTVRGDAGLIITLRTSQRIIAVVP